MTALDKQVIMLTGAGGSAGAFLADNLLREGARLALLYRNPDHTEFLSRLQDTFQDDVVMIQGDLNEPDAAQKAVAQTVDRYGHIDGLVNPVGGWLGGKRLHEHTADDLESMLQMDLRPTFNIMQAILPVYMDQEAGKIINFSSMAAYEDGENSAVYAASKAAVTRLSEVAAHEYSGSGVKVFLIAPSILDTEANRSAMPDADYDSWVSMESISEAIKYLLRSGDEVNGTTLKLRGAL